MTTLPMSNSSLFAFAMLSSLCGRTTPWAAHLTDAWPRPLTSGVPSALDIHTAAAYSDRPPCPPRTPPSPTLNAAQRDAVDARRAARAVAAFAGRAAAGDRRAPAPARPARSRTASRTCCSRGVRAGAHAAAHVHAACRARDDAPRAASHGRGARGRGRARRRRVPDHLRLPWSGTFHSIGNRLIREYAPRLGLDPGFSVLDRGDAADLMDVVRHRLGFSKTEKRFPRKDTCLGIYSHRVNTQRPLRHTLETAYPWCLDWEEQLTALCRAYVEAKLEQQVLDYDDLLLYWHVMMADAALAAEIGARFDHVLVDEYQDTNALQAEILLRLKPDGAGLTVVGDDAQAIYSFRAATVDNILEFPGAVHAAGARRHARGELPLDAAGARRRQRADGGGRRGSTASTCAACAARARCRSYVTVLDDQAQAELRRRPRARGARARRRPAPPGRAVPQCRPQRRARARAHAPQHPVREVRRPQVPRGRARQGPARGAALGRQSAQPHRGVPRAAAAARHGSGERAARLRRVRGRRRSRWPALAAHAVPAGDARDAGRRSTRLLADDRRGRRALGRAGRARAAVVRAAARAPVRGGAGAARRSRPARAAAPAARDARIVRHRADARPAAGDAATSRATRCSTRTTSCCRPCTPPRARSGSRCTC